MILVAGINAVQLTGFIVVIASATAAAAAILDVDVSRSLRRRPSLAWVERERDLAANLGWRWRTWVAVRVALVVAGVGVGVLTRVAVLVMLGAVVGTVGFRFAVAGRAASRRLRMERAFLGRLRDLRDRMAIGNQSLDTALQEIGRDPGPGLEHLLEPLAWSGPVADGIVAVGERARSPVVEYACAVLLWARTRSVDALIDTIDRLLLPVGEMQLAVEEEAAVTLTQQRSVTVAMSALMAVMFAVALRVDTFRAFYQSLAGNVTLVIVIVLFASLVALLGVIVHVRGWTRWNLRRLADEQERLGAR